MSRLTHLVAMLPVAAGLSVASAVPALAAAQPAGPGGTSIAWLGSAVSGQGAAIGGHLSPAHSAVRHAVAMHPATRHPAARRPTVKAKTLRHGVSSTTGAKGIVAKTTPKTGPGGTVAHTTTAQIDVTLSPFEARLLLLVDNARAAAGLGSLRAVPGATDVARRWSASLAQANALSHNPLLVADLAAAGSASWHTLAENVGAAPANDPDGLFAAYMSSPHHRANILDPSVTVIGIGVIQVHSPVGATAWNVMDFADSYSDSYGAQQTHPLSGVIDPTSISAAFS